MDLRTCRHGHTWDKDERRQCGTCKAAYEKTRPKRNRASEQRITHPDQAKAWRAVEYAKKKGTLPNAKSLKCSDCGKPAREYDHYLGYDKQHRLHVQPVCRPCHVERNRARRTVERIANATILQPLKKRIAAARKRLGGGVGPPL